jgi:hypothetical protein
MSQDRDRKISGYPSLGDIQMFVAEVVNNKDEHQKSRFRCRMIGHEKDTINVPDETLPFYSALTPETAHRGMGYNPRYVPGDKVICLQFGDERLIVGAMRKNDPVEGEDADVNPATLDGSSSHHSPADESNDRERGWDQNPSSKKTTEEARRAKRRREGSKKTQGESKAKSPHGRTIARFMDKLSIGKDLPFDNQKNAMQFIQNKINNSGAVVPEMLKMVEQLRTKPAGTNPHAIMAVGPQNYMQFVSNLSKYFTQIATLFQQQQEKNKQTEEEKQREEEQMNKANELLIQEKIENGG